MQFMVTTEAAGVTLSATMLSVTEGTTETYTIRLNRQPTGNVMVTPTSNEPTVATVSGTLTFTPNNWSTPQMVRVTGVDNGAINASDRSTTITHRIVGGGYDAIPVPDVTVRTIDALPVASILSNDDESTTDTAFFMLRVMPAPTSDLEVRIRVSFGSPQAQSLVALPNLSAGGFGVAAQTSAQPVREGENTVTIPAGSTSVELTVEGVGGRRVTVTVEMGVGYNIGGGAEVGGGASAVIEPNVAVSPNAVRVSENGGMASYTLALTLRPTEDVTVMPASNDGTVVTVSGPLTFNVNNWNQPQTVTVRGVDDFIDNDLPRTAIISHTIAGGGYEEVAVASVMVTAIDDDTARVTVSPTELSVNEADGTGTYTVVLNSQPTADVTVTPMSSDDMVAMVPGPLTFTPSNWNQPQTVTVRGVDDLIDNEGDRTATISHTVSGGDYGGVSIDPVMVTATDDDSTGATVSPIALTVDEAGGTGTYTVVLNSQPTADVTITPASEDGTVATVSDPLTFTPSNWNMPQTVTVTGVDDNALNDPARRTRVTHTVSGGNYGGIVIDDVSVTAVDDEVAAISIRAVETSVIEGAPVQFRLTVTPMPTADMVIAITVTDPDGVLVEAAPTTVAIEANQSTTLLELATDDDGVDELDATVTVTLEEAAATDYTVAAAPDNRASITVIDNDGLTREQRERGIKHALGAFGRAAGWDLAETIRNRSRDTAQQGKAFEIVNLPSFGSSGIDRPRPMSMDLFDLLERDAEIRMTFNPPSAEASPSDSSDNSPLVRAWIKGSKTDVRSNPFDGRTQEGEVVIGRFGIDATYASGWVLGAAFSWQDANIEFDDSTFATSGGVDVDLLSVNPYVSFTKGKLHLWGTIGGGLGTLSYEDSPTDAPTSTSSDLRMLTAAAGAEYAFGRFGPFDLKGRGEGMIVDIDADGSSHPLVGYEEIGITVYGARGEFELGLPLQFDDNRTEFRPYVFTGLRRDGGLADGLALEYGGGFALRTGSLSAEGSVRSQVGRDDDDVELKGYSISLAYDRGNDRKGLLAEFEQSAGPSNYDPYSVGALSSFSPSAAGTATRLRLGYGIGWDEQLLRPFVQMDWRESQQSDLDLGLEYQYSDGSANLSYSDGELNLRFRFRKLF